LPWRKCADWREWDGQDYAVLYAACDEKETNTNIESINRYLPQYFGAVVFVGNSDMEIGYADGNTIHWKLKHPGVHNMNSDNAASDTAKLSSGVEIDVSAALTIRRETVPNAVYIPEKDILEHSKGLLTFIEQKQTGFSLVYFSLVYFSLVYKNVLLAAQDIPTRAQSSMQKAVGQKIVDVIGGDVRWDKGDGSFYTLRTDGNHIPFANEASGYKKLGYLGLLVSSGQLNSDSVLFWDEPENSLNPELIPTLIDILLELQRGGVQIFIATHSYDVARWFELNRTADNTLRYFNLRKDGDSIVADVAGDYVPLPNSVIEDAGDLLLRRVAEVAAESAGVKLK
jgi:hypothetical protein